MREQYQIEIKNRISSFDSGHAFTAADFKDLADTDPTNKALSRLCEEGTIRRIMQGVYDKPIYSTLLKEYSAPSMDSAAAALARKFNWTVAPAGETALNELHLSTQVSNRWTYISDGPYRTYAIEPYTIEFRHCANREISGRSRITAAVIQALRFIGKAHVQPEDLDRLSASLSNADKETILREAQTAPAWICRLVKEICKA